MAEKYVQTLDRSLDVLEVLAQAEEALGVTEIGNLISLHKSTVYRILHTLCHRGYVERVKDNERYKLGIKIVELGMRFLNDLEIRKVASPVLNDLAKLLDEVVHLVLPDDGQVVYIDKAESSHIVSMSSKVGRRAPMHCTAVGKALLSTLPEEEVRHILEVKGMKRYTPNTIVEPEALLAYLREIKASKISVEIEENEIGIICLGTPVFDYSGLAIGAISVSGPAERIKDKGIERIGQAMKSAGEEISALMGCNFFRKS